MATIRYKEGFPTRIPTAPKLDRMLHELGAPREIKRQGIDLIVIEWAPLYPGVPIPIYNLHEPFPDKRRLAIDTITED